MRFKRNILSVGDLGDFNRFLRAAALRTSQVLSYSDLARDVGISPVTAKKWLSVLVASGQVFLVESYHRNRGKHQALDDFGGVLLAPFLVLTALGLAHWKGNPFLPLVPPGKSLVSGFGGAVVLGIWLYSGFDKLSAAAEEVEDPQRNFPRALLIAAVLAMASYLLPTLAALAANGDWKLWSGAYFPEAAAKLGGPGLKGLMVFGALCSNALLLNVTMLSASRMPPAMAEDGFLPRAFARPHPRYGTPALSLTAGSLVYSLFSLFNFTQLAVVYAWFQMASYILLYANAWALRRAQPDAVRPFRIPGGRWGLLSALGLTCGLAALAVSASVLKDGRFVASQAAVGLLAMVSGPLAYRALRP